MFKQVNLPIHIYTYTYTHTHIHPHSNIINPSETRDSLIPYTHLTIQLLGLIIVLYMINIHYVCVSCFYFNTKTYLNITQFTYMCTVQHNIENNIILTHSSTYVFIKELFRLFTLNRHTHTPIHIHTHTHIYIHFLSIVDYR